MNGCHRGYLCILGYSFHGYLAYICLGFFLHISLLGINPAQEVKSVAGGTSIKIMQLFQHE